MWSRRITEKSAFGAEGPSEGDGIPTGSGQGRVLAYIRRSAEDRRGKPMKAQIDTIMNYVRECLLPREREGDVVGVRAFFADNGVPGTVAPEERPGFSALIRELDVVPRAHVVVYDTTRLARSAEAGASIKRIIDRKGALLHLAQSRTVVEGASSEMIFGINLQMASAERTAAITRIRSAFEHHPDWDPRRSFGWRFIGAGIPPEEIPEEQDILKRMRDMYEVEGLPVAEIAKRLQDETRGRRWRRDPSDPLSGENAKWRGSEVSFLANKHRWKWGGIGDKRITREELETRAITAAADGVSCDAFMDQHEGFMYDGVKINRNTLKKFFPEEQPASRRRALDLAVGWYRAERHSVDDVCMMLNTECPREDGKPWTRQTAWRIFQEAKRVAKLEDEQRRGRELERRR